MKTAQNATGFEQTRKLELRYSLSLSIGTRSIAETVSKLVLTLWRLPETDKPDLKKNERKPDTVEANLRSEQCEFQTSKMSRFPFARAEECGTNSASVVQQNLGLPTSATTCSQPESTYFSFVNSNWSSKPISEANLIKLVSTRIQTRVPA